MTTYQVLAWHGIPTQIRARDAGTRASVSVQLAVRFQDAIDKAAMAAKLTGSEEYMAGFQWGPRQERDGTAHEVAAAVAAEIEAEYPEVDWRKIAAALKARG